MAVTETVKIVFEVDDKALVSTVSQLQAVGKVSAELAAKFNELANDSKVASTSLSEASSSADKFASAGKQIAGNVKETNDALKQIPGASKPIKDLGNEANNSASKFVSLKTRLKEAKDEVQRLIDQGFSPLSKEVLTAQNRAGALSDELGDLNRQVSLLNPESKVQAFTNFGQGIVGAFQVATGALQAFGVENERVQQIAQRLQGALNVAQGIQSIIQLREAFSDLSVVVSSSAAAIDTISSGAKGIELLGQAASSASDSSDALTDSLESAIGAAGNSASVIGAYNKTQKTTEQVTNAATTSTKGLNAALKANPALILATAIGALVGALVLLKDSTKNAAQSEEEFNNIKDDSKEATDKLKDAEDELAISRDKNAKFDIDRRKNFEALQKDLLKLYDNQRLAQEELNKAEAEFNKLGVGAGKSLVAERKARLEAAEKQKATTDQAIKDRIKEFNINGQIITQKEIESKLDKTKSDQSKKQSDAIKQVNDNRQNTIKLINDEIASLQEAERGALIGVNDEIQRIAITDSFREKITAKQIERAKLTGESIILIEQKAANDQKQSFEDLFAAVEAARDKDVADAQKAAKDKLDAERQAIEQALALNKLDNLIAFQKQSIALNSQLNQRKGESDKDYAKRKEQILRDLDRIERELRIANLKSELDAQDKKLKKLKEAGKEGTDEYKKAAKEQEVTSNELTQAQTDNANKVAEATTKTSKKSVDVNADVLNQYIEQAQAAFDLVADIQRERTQREIDDLDEQREKGLITEEQYQEKLAEIKRKQAVADKNAAIFAATLQFSQALINALTITPSTAAPAALALAAAIAGANLAKIIATPLPKFKQGTLAVPGYDTGEDTVHAMLRPGEAVIPTEMNREYAQTIKAIYTRKVSAKDLNDFVSGRMSVVKDEPVFNFNPITMDALFKRDLRVSRINSAVDRASGGIMPTINVKADIDTYALGKVMSKNKSMEVTNVESIGEAVAEALTRRTNRRQQL